MSPGERPTNARAISRPYDSTAAGSSQIDSPYPVTPSSVSTAKRTRFTPSCTPERQWNGCTSGSAIGVAVTAVIFTALLLSAVPSAATTTPYSRSAASRLTFSFRTSFATAAGSRSQRIAPAAAAGGAVLVDVARLDLDREHRRQHLLGPVGVEQHVARERPGAAAREAVGRVLGPVGADDQRRARREAAPDALDREAAAVQAGAARVGHEPVPLDHDRVLGLGDLDRDVRGEARRVREAVVAVRLRRAAPGADDELVEDEALAVGPFGAEDRERVAALARGGARGPGAAARARRRRRRRCGTPSRRASRRRPA